jgi:gliding motility-associated-like protein
MLMKKLNSTLILLLVSVQLLVAQSTFRINYDVALFDIPVVSTEALTNGNYIFSGFHANFVPFVSSLTEVDGSGNVVWSKRYSGGIAYMFGDVKKDNTLNRYYACGGDDGGPAFLLFLDATGNLISGRNFSISQATGAFFNRVQKTSDGGYICVGYVTGHNPGGGETNFVSVTNNQPSCSSSATETIQSPLIVKFDASGNVLWHHVFRYYAGSVATGNRIYNDGAFVDIVEVSDGYVAVGNYDVNNAFSTYDTDDCDDTTPTDAMFLKTTTAGVITYHRQLDAPSNSTSQSSKSIVSMSKTTAGNPIIALNDGSGRPAHFMRLPNSGGWAVQWERKYGAANLFGTYYPFLPSRIFETSDGNYGIWLNYIPLVSFSNVLMKVNPSTNVVAFAKQYNFNLASIFPHGHQVSDGGYIGLSYTLAGTGHNMHFIKTDANGDGPSTCAATNLTVSNGSITSTIGTPLFNSWNSGTVTNGNATPLVTPITPTTTVDCIQTVCTPPAAPVGVTAAPATICSGSSSVINVSPLVSGVNYNVYTAATGGTNLGAIPQTVSPTGTTTYYVEAVNSSDPLCVSTTRTPITVTVNNAPTATVGSNSPICAGQTLNLTNNTLSGATYAWTGPNGFTSTSANPSIPSATTAATGTYTLIITNNGCPSAPATVNVTVAAPPTATAGSNTPVCVGSPINLTANTVAGATYAWTGPNSFSSSLEDPSISSSTTLMAGTYNLTITVGTCTATSSTTVVVNAAPTVTVPSSGLVCIGGTLNLTPSTGGTWSSSNAGIASITNGGVVTGVGAGSANMTFTNSATGCSSNPTSATITVNPIPTATASSNSPVCVGSAINLTGSVSTGTYSWTGPNGFISSIQSPTIGASTTAMAGTYSLIITENGCQSAAATTTVVVNTLPTITASATPTTICAGNTINLAGGGGSTYTWTGPNTFASTSQNPTVTSATTAASGTYTVTGVAANGCSNTATVLVNVTNGPTVSISPNNIACNGGTTGSAFVNVSGTAPYTYLWTPSGQTGQTASNLTAGSYSVLVSDANGCQSTATTTLTEPSAITLTSSSNPSSCTTPTGSATVNASGGAGGFTYFWAPSGGTSNTAVNIAAGSYTVTVTDANFCQQTATVNVPSVNGPSVTLTGVNNVTCFGGNNGSATAVASLGTPGYTYLWSPSGGNAASATGLTSGSYTVSVTDNAGCTTSETVTITQPNQLVISETITAAACGSTNGAISLAVTGGTGAYTYSWTPSSVTGSLASNLAGGAYSVVVTDAAGCNLTESYVVTVSGSLNVSLDPEISDILQGDSVLLTTTVVPANAGYTYTWNPSTDLSCASCANPFASPNETTTYIVTVTSPDGCTGSDTAIVNVEIVCGDYFLPNIFSPNGDGNNDELCLLGNCIEKFDLKIYDRWGELVFESKDQNVCWDGKFKGQIMNTATYVYVMEITLTTGEVIKEQGNLNLVR